MPWVHSLIRLSPFFRLKEDIFFDKNPLKISARSELWIFGYLRNYEGRQNSGKNTRETERDRSNLGGALAPLGGTTAKDQRGEPLPI